MKGRQRVFTAASVCLGGLLMVSPGPGVAQEGGPEDELVVDEPVLGASLICALLPPDLGPDDPIPDDAEAFLLLRFDTEDRGSAFIIDTGGHVSFAPGGRQANGSWMARGWQTRDGSPPYTTLMTLTDTGTVLISKPMGGGSSATFGGRCEDRPME